MKKGEEMTVNVPANIAGAVCYVPGIGWVASLVLLLLEKNKQVRWHACQGLILGLAMMVSAFVLGATIILAVLVPALWVAGVIVQLVLAVRTYQEKTVRLPKIAEWADKLLAKLAAG
jgi:uncharacterized membrane protein